MLSLNLKDSKCLEYGINVHDLKPGTIVLAVTKNSLYKIIKGKLDKYDILVHGGKHFLEPVKGNFSGSTFGGSMIKIGWIGYGMHMEIHIPSYKKTYKTTPVKAARIVGNDWEYTMEWESQLPLP